ncbi:hypothetical protein MTR67_041604 [Solanum verrucosum]|uniref:F-box domain-containing protein n=1 Tax=Solanum verrucosum TaxID=315347 RepID=A0AAF0ULS0_SOLVR|nr:hypothetical protein MTR67_041604 [Solanum verrucosum]
MADSINFPTDLTINILLNLPKKSLIRFKSVNESWRSLIEDHQFIEQHYYLNQILNALKKERVCSIDDPIIDPPSIVSHQLSIKFINSNINAAFLLAVPMPDRIVFWNPENLNESASISRVIEDTTSTTYFSLGERNYFAKFSLVPYYATSWYKPDYLEVSTMNMRSTSYSWENMLKIEEPGTVLLRKRNGYNRGFKFYRSDNNGRVVIYYLKTEELKEFANRITESKRKLEEFDDDDEPQVLLFIDRTYAEGLISSNDDTLY